MRFSIVSDTKVGTSTPTAGTGLLLQNPQKVSGLWLGDPADFGDTPPATEGVGLRLIDPQGVSGLILGTPSYEVTSPVPVEAPTIEHFITNGSTTLYIDYRDNQTVPADSFVINVYKSGVLEQSINTTDNPYIITGLDPATTYRAIMLAVVGGLNSGPSVEEFATTAEVSDFVPDDHKSFEGISGTSALLNKNPLATDGFSSGINPSTPEFPSFSNDVAWTGTTSAKVPVKKFPTPTSGDEYYAWGADFSGTDGKAGVNDEYWWRVLVYFPVGFSWGSGGVSQRGEAIKMFRAYQKDAVIQPGGSTTGNWGYAIEYGGVDWNGGMSVTNGIGAQSIQSDFYDSVRNPWPDPGDNEYLGSSLPVGEWVNLEMYMRMGSNLDGVHRYYVNGTLVFEQAGINTTTTNGKTRKFALFTYWNDGAPKDQHCYIGDHCFTTSTPPNTDAFGRPIIGSWTP